MKGKGDIHILGAARMLRGRPSGALSPLSALELGGGTVMECKTTSRNAFV